MDKEELKIVIENYAEGVRVDKGVDGSAVMIDCEDGEIIWIDEVDEITDSKEILNLIIEAGWDDIVRVCEVYENVKDWTKIDVII